MDEEEKRKLGASMAMELRRLRNKAREEHLARMEQPLCYRVYHPFLGNGVFMDTCPDCGWKSTVDEEKDHEDT